MMKTKTIRPGRIFSGIVLVFWTIVSIFPLYWMFIFSLKNNDEIYSGNPLALPQNWVWSNYTDALSKGHMARYFFNSILVTGVTILLTIVIALTASYAV